MSHFIIKDTTKNWWLQVDRFLNMRGDIITGVEPVGSMYAATRFRSEEDCKEAIEMLKNESDYELTDYAIQNLEQLVEEQNKAAEEANKKIQDYLEKKLEERIARAKKTGATEEEIEMIKQEGIRISDEEIEQVLKGE